MSRSLLASRRFAPLLGCQLASLANDSFVKRALALLILVRIGGRDGALLVTLAAALFTLPVLLLSGLAGELADRSDKAALARRLKLAEIVTAAVAAVGLYAYSYPLLLAAVFALGTINALFAPVAFGMLPDHLRSEELPAANGFLVTAAFVAVLLGTIGGGLAIDSPGATVVIGAASLTLAILSWLASRSIPSTAPAAPALTVDVNLLRSSIRLIAGWWSDGRLRRLGVAIAVFWLIVTVVMYLLPLAAMAVLHGSARVVTILSAVVTVAIGLGAALAAWLSAGRIVLLPAAIGALLITLFAGDLAWVLLRPVLLASTELAPAEFFAQPSSWRLSFDLAMLAVSGGLLVVPSLAALQVWAAPERRARTLAAVNLVGTVLLASGALAAAFAASAGVTVSSLFVAVAATALSTALWIFGTMPTRPAHELLTILLRAFYRLEVHGLENLDRAGPGAIIALNHVSFLDAAAALSILPEEPVFAIDHQIARRWWVKPFLKLTRVVPLDPTRPLAARTLINIVKGGDRLVIFPEGRITVTGRLMKVYDGAAMIAEKADAPIVPVRIDGLEATIFSRLTRAQVRRRWFPKVRVTVLEPVRLTVDARLKGKARRHAAGAALYQIMSDLIFRTTRSDRTVLAAIVDAARQHGWRRVAVEDPVTGSLSYRKLLLAARVLAGKLAPLAAQQGDALGVMLPTANGAAATILGVMSAGRVPAMINFTAGSANILSACAAARVDTILTSRRFVEIGRFEQLVEALAAKLRIVYLEDVRATVSAVDKLRGLLGHRRALAARDPDDPAVILFTSGSEGAPKGVVLSHRNLLTNAAQAVARIDFGRTDKVFNVLPVFHCFGLTIGLLLPLLSGVPVFLYPSPLHYRIVPELVYGVNATILFGTDTFLSGYARAAHPYDFRSLRYVLAGAEPVREPTRRVWGEKFGLRILEGYGITEAAPAVALNTPMFNRSGTVGRFLPGVEARLEAIAGIEDGGRLYLRGPNIMLGYLRADQPGLLLPPQEGWHDTGDIVAIDEDGFVSIRGRAKRFAKIGGEMVSLAAVEHLAAELWPDFASAVVAESDPRKGERLVLVTDNGQATRPAFAAHARSRGASELMVPAEIAVIDKLPVLGSGKLDLVGVARLIRQRPGGEPKLELDTAATEGNPPSRAPRRIAAGRLI